MTKHYGVIRFLANGILIIKRVYSYDLEHPENMGPEEDIFLIRF